MKELFTTAKQEIESIAQGKVLGENTYHMYVVKYGSMFEAEIGAEAIYKLFKNIREILVLTDYTLINNV